MNYKYHKITTRVIAVFIVIIVSFFGINKSGAQSVISYNQSGGITANNVNVGTPERHLNPDIINHLNAILLNFKGKLIHITAVMGDQEAFQYGEEIMKYLQDNGWKVSGVDQAIFSKPQIGQSIYPNPDGSVGITIGARLIN